MTWKSLNVCQVGNCFADFRDKTSKLSKVKSCNKTTFILRAFHWSRKILMQVISRKYFLETLNICYLAKAKP